MAKKKVSYAWESFMENFFERLSYMQWHDGINPDVVLGLNEEEQRAAEDLLIESVERDDMWPTRGLAALKSKKAIPVLKKKVENSQGIIRLRNAFALEMIQQEGKYLPVIIEELKNNPSHYDRLEAAMNLRHFPSKQAVQALYEGMRDEEYLVRYHSSESLLKIYGLVPDIVQYDEIFSLIVTKTKEGKNTEEEYAKAIKLLKEKFKNKTFESYTNKE